MINPTLRRTALAAAAVVAALSLPAAASDETGLGAALGAMKAPLVNMGQLKTLSQVSSPTRVQFATVQAGAEKLKLVCEGENGHSMEFLIDFAQKIVFDLLDVGCTWDIEGRKLVVPDCYPPGRAVINESLISWTTTKKRVTATGVISTNEIEGSINRLTGSLSYREYGPSGMIWGDFRAQCRRASQKF